MRRPPERNGPPRGPRPPAPDRRDPPLAPAGGVLPLYQEAVAARPALAVARGAWAGNAGLWWSKFCDRWQDDFSGLVEVELQAAGQGRAADKRAGKADWISSLVHPRGADGRLDTGRMVCAGNPDLLAEHARRRAALVTAQAGQRRTLTLTAPFVTGTGLPHAVENGFAFHHLLGVPYLPGSAVKGVARAWAERVLELPGRDLETLFGRRGEEARGVGAVVFLDALPAAPVQLVMEGMTPHLGEWLLTDRPDLNPPADWIDPNPIPFLAVAAGAAFDFAVLPRPGGGRDAAEVLDWLAEALDWLGAGAKTAVGFGRFRAAANETSGGGRAVTESVDKSDPDLARRFRNGDWVSGPDGIEGEVVGIVGGLVEVYLDEEGTRRRYRPDQLRRA
jgi:CRISPR-associated protein Cmr6